MRLREQGCHGSSYLGRWDPLDQQPHGGGSRGWSGAWSKAAEQRSKCSVGASRVLEADRERDSREDEEGEDWRSWESRGAREGEGLRAAGRRGRGQRLSWEEAGVPLPGWFSLMLTACYLLSI